MNFRTYIYRIFNKQMFSVVHWALMTFFFVGLTLYPLQIAVSESSHFSKTISEPQEITLIFGGDVMQHMPQVNAAWNEVAQTHNYDSCFFHIKPYFENADFAIINLETTFAGKPYSGYPAFSAPDALAGSLKNMGVDLIGTANNHCCDKGRVGIERTVAILDTLKISHMGTYANTECYQKNNPHVFNVKGIKLAFMNYTYGTNGLPVPQGNVVSFIEKERMQTDLQLAKATSPDKIIVFIHWGEEYQRYPNAIQKETAKFLFEQGADIIIGSHPHVIQHMEWARQDSVNKEKFVVWSMGNFVSNQRKQFTDGGAAVQIKLTKQLEKTTITNAGYLLTWVYTPYEKGRKRYYVLPAANFENDTLVLPQTDRKTLKTFIQDSRELLNAKNINVKEIK